MASFVPPSVIGRFNCLEVLVRDMGELSEEIITTMLADIPLLQVSGTRHIGTGQGHA